MDNGAPIKNSQLINRDATVTNFVDSEQKLNLIASCEDSAIDWEESVKRDGWTPLQHRIFNKVSRCTRCISGYIMLKC